MTARLAHIYRHPIKSHGREELGAVALTPGQTLPWDRHWAVTHDRSKWDAAAPGWMECVNFMRGARTASLMAINAALDQASGQITLTHPDLPPLTIHPDDPADQTRFLDWLAAILPAEDVPVAVVKAPSRGMTDTDFPSVSIAGLASNADLGRAMAADLSPLRWRANLWVDGWEPWSELALPGQSLRIGDAVLAVRERIGRCKATSANPATGVIDHDTLAGLRARIGAQDFGVYAVVTTGGTIRTGDPVEVLA